MPKRMTPEEEQAQPKLPLEFFKQIPKADLHVHLDGSLRLETIIDLAKHHKVEFQLVRDNNINCTIHAGEAYGPESIAQALHVCGAHRIGHGCRLREDGDLLHYINDHRIPLEVCPSSNVQTGAVRDLKAHQLKFYFDYGLRVTINNDNRLIIDTTVTKEYWTAHQELHLSLEDLTTIIVSGFKSAFLPFREKQDMLKAVNEEIATTLQTFQRKLTAVKKPA